MQKIPAAPRADYWMRRAARNVAIAVAATLVCFVVFALSTDKTSWAFRASMGTGYASVALMAWALAIGPWRVLRGATRTPSLDLRRDVGIWSAVFAIGHVVTGLQVHMGGDMLRYFIFRPEDGHHPLPLRTDPFGIVNWTGLVAALVLVFLVLISNDRSLRTLGTRRWKQLQRLTYVAAVLTALHGIVFQLMDRRSLPFIVLFLLAIAVVVLAQLKGRSAVISRDRPTGQAE
jgi:methionine sulfoxide reductase heme-binding subunit